MTEKPTIDCEHDVEEARHREVLDALAGIQRVLEEIRDRLGSTLTIEGTVGTYESGQ